MKLIYNTLLIFLIGFCIENVAAQNWVSVKSFDSLEDITPTPSSLKFPSSNDYVTYSDFSDTLVIGQDTVIAQDYSDLVIRRVNSNKEVVWTQVLQSSGYEYISSACIDNQGNVYVSGVYEGIQLDAADTSIVNVGVNDGFLAKYDENGNLIWLKSFSSNVYDAVQGVKVNSNREVFLSGQSTDYETSISILFIIKMDESGNVLDIHTTRTTGYSYYYDFNLKENNELEIIGVLFGDLIVDNSQVFQIGDSNAFFKIIVDANFNTKSISKSKDYTYFNGFNFIKNHIYIFITEAYVYNEEYYQYVDLNRVICLDENFNEKWNYLINEKVLESMDFETEEFGEFINTVNLDNEGNTILAIGSVSSRFICNNDTAYYKVYKDYDDVVLPENYIVALDSNGNEKMFYYFDTELSSATIFIDILENGNILLGGYYQDSILNIGDFQLYNENLLYDGYAWIHNYHYVFRDNKFYLAEFNFSPSTGLISQQNASLSSTLYPNPSNNIVKIKFEKPLSSYAELTVFSIDGKLITKQNFPSGTSEIQLDVSDFLKGIYLVGVQSGEERVVHKFLKN